MTPPRPVKPTWRRWWTRAELAEHRRLMPDGPGRYVMGTCVHAVRRETWYSRWRDRRWWARHHPIPDDVLDAMIVDADPARDLSI